MKIVTTVLYQNYKEVWTQKGAHTRIGLTETTSQNLKWRYGIVAFYEPRIGKCRIIDHEGHQREVGARYAQGLIRRQTDVAYLDRIGKHPEISPDSPEFTTDFDDCVNFPRKVSRPEELV